MTEENQQAVVEETDVQAAPDTEVVNAPEKDELDDLLAQYDQAQPAVEPQQPVANSEEQRSDQYDDDLNISDVMKRLDERDARDEAARKAEQDRQFKIDMDKTVANVRGEFDPSVFDDTFMESWIDAQARNDPRLQNAWANRHNDPKAFGQIVEGLGRNFNKKFKALPDKQVTEDREAVAEAVRGASKQAPAAKAVDYASMSDAEFSKYTDENFGFRPEI